MNLCLPIDVLGSGQGLEVEEIVLPGDVEAEPQIECRGPRVFSFNKQLNSRSVLQQLLTDRGKTALSQALTSFFGTYIDTLDVSGARRAGNDVQFEDEPVFVHQHPHAIFVDTTQVTLAKSDRIVSQWIDAAHFQRHRRLSTDNSFEIFGSGETKAGDILALLELFRAPQEKHWTNVTRRLCVVCVITPEALHGIVLAHQQMSRRIAPRNRRETLNCSFAESFEQDRMPDERHTFELVMLVAAYIKVSAVLWAD